VLLALYLAYGAPWIMGLFVNGGLAFFLSRAAVAVIRVVLLGAFVWFLFFPISLTLGDPQAQELELFLSAPARPRDLLLGEFVGVMPFYGVGVVIVSGLFTAAIGPLGISILQAIIIVLVFLLLFFSSLWIGTVAAALLRARLGRSERGRDIGKAIGFLLALPVVGIMYAVMGGGLSGSMPHPGDRALITGVWGVLPTSWGASMIVDFANHPGAFGSVWPETAARLSGLIIFFLATLWVGVKIADRAYSLETAGLSASRASPEGFVYRSIRALSGGGSFGAVFVSILKDYARRLQNLSRVGYVVGLVVLIDIFFTQPRDAMGSLIMSQALFALLAAFVVGEVTVRGKETLLIYRGAPGGEKMLIKARLLQGWIITLPIAVGITLFHLMLAPDTGTVMVAFYTGWMGVVVAGYVVLALGWFLMLPAFSDKSGEFTVIAMLAAMFSTMSFIGSLIFFGETWALLSVVMLVWPLAILFLLLGRRNLHRIE